MSIRSVISNPADGRKQPAGAGSRWATAAGACLIALAALTAWHNSFSGAFVFDDVPAITGNATIQRLWPVWEPLSLRRTDLTVSGRPLVNFSLAINYAMSGTKVWSYHALNLAIHILAGLILFGIVRRTLVGAASCAALGRNKVAPLPKDALALVIALLWTVHPLQTEAVTYVVQRVESLMGLFYLLTLYCFIRGVDCHVLRDNGNERPSDSSRLCHLLSDKPPGVLSGIWFAFSVLACLLGMACKEVMVSAPLIVFLYDRTFVAGSFREAWQQRKRLYAGLAATWLLLFWLVATTTSRGGSAGFGTAVTWWEYARIQCQAVVHYLWLSFWPHPLVFDYGIVEAKSVLDVAPQGLILVALLAGTVIALWRRSILGFLGAWFFLILAPSSSIVPVATQTMAEHRMYLPLAAVVVLVVSGVSRLLGARSVAVFAILAVGLGWTTVQRNADYRSEFTIWSDSANKRPDNARAYNNLGSLWLKQGNLEEAMRCFTTALQLQPYYASAHYDLGIALAGSGRLVEAIAHFEKALAIEPDSADIRLNLGNTLVQLGQVAAAIPHYETALRLEPDSADAHIDLGLALVKLNRLDEAIEHYEAAVRIQPDFPDAQVDLGAALLKAGRADEAVRHYEAAVRLKAGDAGARFALGNVFAQTGRFSEAIAEYTEVLRLDPGHVLARNNLGNALLVAGRVDEAIAEYEKILRVQPANASVRENLEKARTLQRAVKPGR